MQRFDQAADIRLLGLVGVLRKLEVDVGRTELAGSGCGSVDLVACGEQRRSRSVRTADLVELVVLAEVVAG